MIADLVSRIFPVAKQYEPFLDIDVWPLRLADLFLAHRCCDRIAHDATHWEHLAWIGLKILDEFIKFVLRRSPIAFDASADKVEVL